MLEGVAFSMRDCLDALARAGTRITGADVIGGGSRSRTWTLLLAAVLGIPLHRLAGGEHGGAFGAARLARLALTGEDPDAVCLPPAADRDDRAGRRLGRCEPGPAGPLPLAVSSGTRGHRSRLAGPLRPRLPVP